MLENYPVPEVQDIDYGISVEKMLRILESRYGVRSEDFLDTSYLDEDEDDRLYSLPLNPKIKLHEMEEALFWRDYARGTIGIFAPVGTGKTLLLVTIALKMFYFFLRPAVLDFYPKRAFIDYVGEENYSFVDEEILLEDLREADKLARDEQWSLRDVSERKREWILQGMGSSGVKLHGSTFGMSEIDRWLNKRRTGTKINNLLTPMFKQWRHNDILILGDCVDKSDLDAQRVQPRFSCIVYPNPLGDHQFQYIFKSVQRLTKGGVEYKARVDKLTLDGRDIYPFYNTRSPIALDPNMRAKERKQNVHEGK